MGEKKLYFSFDAETDGLYGEAFAIGAAVVTREGEVLDRFAGKCVKPCIESEWVKQNCLPYLHTLPDYPSREALKAAFWDFYAQYRERCVILADVPCPVEAKLLRDCVQEKPGEREFLGPFPLIDVASMLYARGVDPLIDRKEYSGCAGDAHNPLDDAIASALCAVRVMKSERS